MTSPIWLLKSVVLALHDAELAKHGGMSSIRDDGALDRALARPENRFAYAEPDLVDLAAAEAFDPAMNHPFIDGNKRASLTACASVLRRNGLDLVASEAECIAVWLALAAGTLYEAALAAWRRQRVRALT
jgi:death-on-curing protein